MEVGTARAAEGAGLRGREAAAVLDESDHGSRGLGDGVADGVAVLVHGDADGVVGVVAVVQRPRQRDSAPSMMDRGVEMGRVHPRFILDAGREYQRQHQRDAPRRPHASKRAFPPCALRRHSVMRVRC